MEDVNMELDITDLPSSIYVDTAHVFSNRNELIPKDQRYHSFLLDKRLNVIFVGSPIENENVKRVYKKVINNK